MMGRISSVRPVGSRDTPAMEVIYPDSPHPLLSHTLPLFQGVWPPEGRHIQERWVGAG